MAGTSQKVDHGYIEFDDGGVNGMLKRLHDLGGNLEAPFADIGEYLLTSVEDRFDDEAGPRGEEWQELSPRTRARKQHPKILTETGHLRAGFSYDPGPDELVFGTNVIYAATHQYGRGAIPARPLLGFDTTDEFEIGEIVVQHLKEAGAG